MKKIIILWKECFRGKSLPRTLHNIYLNEKIFVGQGIDYGAKYATSSYYRFINLDKSNMDFTDFYVENDTNIIQIDFEKEFNLSEKGYDFALVMNVLEHVFEHKLFLRCVQKSLRKSGIIEGYVPFLHHYHKDPDDYFRYTHSALLKLLMDAGFTNIQITKIGIGGFTASAGLISRILKFKALVFLCWVLCLTLDHLLSKVWKTNRDMYCGLCFTAEKQ